MKNAQWLTGTGGCSKHVCKYLSKTDEQNYVIVDIDRRGKLVTEEFFLHNTKITSSKKREDKDRDKHRNKIPERCINNMEMLHGTLGHVEVVTNVEFIKISTMSLELRDGIKIKSDAQRNDDGSYLITEVDSF